MKVLFVCLGNICRSPTAESIFRCKSEALGHAMSYDSAGTANYHVGEASDQRSISHAEARGYPMRHKARQVQQSDFEKFDLILAMDASNQKNLEALCPAKLRHKIKLVTDYCSGPHPGFVPDPYYGAPQDFELVIDILENAFTGFATKHCG